MGKTRCESLLPSTDLSEIRSLQQQTHDALSRLFKRAASLSEMRKISGLL